MNSHTITKGDTGTPLDFVVGDRNGPTDLTGATVLFRFSVGGVVTEKSCTPDPDQVTNKGRASAFWGASELDDVDTETNHPCHVKATLSTGRVRYFPQRGYGVLTVQSPL